MRHFRLGSYILQRVLLGELPQPLTIRIAEGAVNIEVAMDDYAPWLQQHDESRAQGEDFELLIRGPEL